MALLELRNNMSLTRFIFNRQVMIASIYISLFSYAFLDYVTPNKISYCTKLILAQAHLNNNNSQPLVTVINHNNYLSSLAFLCVTARIHFQTGYYYLHYTQINTLFILDLLKNGV